MVEIKMRSTTVRTLNNIAVIVPNSEFVSSKLENWSYGDQNVRVDIDIGVSYESNLQKVMRSLLEVAEEHPEVLKHPAAIVQKFQQNGVEIPFPQRDLHLRSPLPLPTTAGS